MTGLATGDSPSERVQLVEREWPKHIHRRSLPRFWADEATRRLAIDLWGTTTLDRAVAATRAKVGIEHAPSRSALARLWRTIDRIMKTA